MFQSSSRWQILFVILLCSFYRFAAEASKYVCGFNTISPSIGVYAGGTNVTINMVCNSNDYSAIINEILSYTALFGAVQVPIISAEKAGYILTDSHGPHPSQQVLWKYAAQCRSPLLEGFTFTGNSSVVLLQLQGSTNILGITGSLPYQYYNFSDIGIVESNDVNPLQSSGGQTACVGIDKFVFLQDLSLASMRFSQNTQRVVYPLGTADLLKNTSYVALCATTDNRVAIFDQKQNVSMEISLDGQDYHYVLNLDFVFSNASKAIFFFEKSATGVSFSSWDYQHNVGIHSETAVFMTSLVTYFNFNLNLFGAPAEAFLPFVVGDDGQSLYSTIFITSDLGSNNAATLKTLVGPQTNVFYCVAPRQSDLSILSAAGVGVYWAELYQARYLNGIIAGLMLPPASEKKSKVCYVKAYTEPENNLALNAFAYGLSKTRPDVKIHFWVAGTNGNTFKLSQLTKMLYDQEDCDHLSMFTFNEQALWIFTNGGRYVTTSNFDARLQLGNNVLSSALIDWSLVYNALFRYALNQNQNHDTNSSESYLLSLGWDSHAVHISDLSAEVNPSILSEFLSYVDEMNSLGAEYVVLKGPVTDTENKTQIPPGYSPTLFELYNINWNMNNTVDEGYYDVVPPSHYDNHIPDSVIYMMYFFLSLSWLVIIVFAVWIKLREEHPLVKFSQPTFVYIVLLGCFLGMYAVLPLAVYRRISDREAYDLQVSGLEGLRDADSDDACESVLWVLTTAFGMTFPILCAKVWKLHRIVLFIKQKNLTMNIKTMKEILDLRVLVAVYLLVLFIPLIIWRFLSPITYAVSVLKTDGYNNPIESTGWCNAKGAEAPAFALVAILFFSFVVGNVVCFIARNDESVNNEITYISIGLVNYFQIFIIVIPLVTLSDTSIFRYVISSFGVIIAFGGLACLMVVPKIIAVEFKDDQGTGLVITRGPGKVDPSIVPNLPPVDSGKDDTNNKNHRVSDFELSIAVSEITNPMKKSSDEG